jgi:hypothetical protein
MPGRHQIAVIPARAMCTYSLLGNTPKLLALGQEGTPSFSSDLLQSELRPSLEHNTRADFYERWRKPRPRYHFPRLPGMLAAFLRKWRR